MNFAEKNILTINGSSSSIKFARFAANRSLRMKLRGQIELIGMPETALSVQGNVQGENFARHVAVKDHMTAFAGQNFIYMHFWSERAVADAQPFP